MNESTYVRDGRGRGRRRWNANTGRRTAPIKRRCNSQSITTAVDCPRKLWWKPVNTNQGNKNTMVFRSVGGCQLSTFVSLLRLLRLLLLLLLC